MPNNGKPQFLRNVFLHQSNGAGAETLDAAVWQDKARNKSARIGTRQPAAVKTPMRAQTLNSKTTRSQNNPNPRRQTVHLDLWVKPIVKAELQRLAEQEGLSMSATGAALLEAAIRQKLHLQQGVLLQPIIKTAIQQQMGSISNRLAWLLVRVAFDTGQTRSLVTNILGRQQGMTEETLKNILAMSQRTAKGNITRRSLEMRELIDAVEKWLLSDDENKEPNN
jgi:hypothetical protein